MNYGFLKARHYTLVLVMSCSFIGATVTLSSNAQSTLKATQGSLMPLRQNVGYLFVEQWESFLEGRRRSPQDFLVANDQVGTFEQVVINWKNTLQKFPPGSLPTYRRHVWEYGQDHAWVMIEAKVSAPAVFGFIFRGQTRMGPVVLELRREGENITVTKIIKRPWLPPFWLGTTFVAWALCGSLGVWLFCRMRRSPELLAHKVANWARRQSFFIFYPNVGLVTLAVSLAGFTEIDSWFFRWLAFKISDNINVTQTRLLLVYIAIQTTVMVLDLTPYLESWRRGPKSITQTSPKSFSFRRMARGVVFQSLVQFSFGSTMWGAAMWLAAHYGIPRLPASAIAALLGIALAQYFWAWWIRHKSVGILSRDLPAAQLAVKALGATSSHLTVHEIYRLPSDDWPYPNAFIIGLGRRHCTVAVTEMLLERLNPNEVAAVLLHEYGHLWERHTILLTLCLSTLATWQLTFIAEGRQWLIAAGITSPATMTFTHQILLFAGVILWMALPFTLLSRWCERRADAMARYLGWGDHLASGLIRLSEATEIPLEWPRWIRWFATHPSVQERVQALRSYPSNEPPIQSRVECDRSGVREP